MITFVTDVRPGEPDILTPFADMDLTIHDALDGGELQRIPAPAGGWPHELLIEQAGRIANIIDSGKPLDARLAGQFVGSTEV